jgi:hypothetical protein
MHSQLNYYGFVHVRSFSTTGSTTTALWVNRELAKHGSAEISSVLMLKRVEPCEAAKTAEGRRVRKELAIFTVEEDIGVSPKSLQMEQIHSMTMQGLEGCIKDPCFLSTHFPSSKSPKQPPVPSEVRCHRPKSPPIFPKLSPRPEQVQRHSLSSCSQATTASSSECTRDQSDSSDAEDAANLLLMLSKSTGTSASGVPYAISPGQFLM